MPISLTKTPRAAAPTVFFDPGEPAKRPRPSPGPPDPPDYATSPPKAALRASRLSLLEAVVGTQVRRAGRHAPQICGFGGDHGTSGGFHDSDGNFYRVGDWIWVMIVEQADTEGKKGRSRDGLDYFCPALILEVYVDPDENDSSRVNQKVDLMAAVNGVMVNAYGLDPDELLPDLGAHGWVLLPQWVFSSV